MSHHPWYIILIWSFFLQENLELFLHPYPSPYLPHCTVCSLALWVCPWLSWVQSLVFTAGIPSYGFSFGLSAASVGLSFLQFTNMNSMRNLVITGLSLYLGISVPQFFNEFLASSHHGPVHTHAGWVSLVSSILSMILRHCGELVLYS